jgi:hypothetical protein
VRSEVETLRLENSELKAKSQEGGQLYEKVRMRVVRIYYYLRRLID